MRERLGKELHKLELDIQTLSYKDNLSEEDVNKAIELINKLSNASDALLLFLIIDTDKDMALYMELAIEARRFLAYLESTYNPEKTAQGEIYDETHITINAIEAPVKVEKKTNVVIQLISNLFIMCANYLFVNSYSQIAVTNEGQQESLAQSAPNTNTHIQNNPNSSFVADSSLTQTDQVFLKGVYYDKGGFDH